MSILGRIFLVLYSLAWIGAAAGLIAMNWNEDQMLDIDVADWNLQAFIDADDAEQWAFTAGMTAVALIGVFTLVLAFRPYSAVRRGSLRLKQSGGGQVEVTADALESLLAEELQRLPSVHTARARVGTRGGDIATELDLTIAAGASIAEVTNAAGDRLAEVFRDQVGVTNVRRPLVRIAYAGGAAPAAAAPLPPPPPPPAPGTGAAGESPHEEERRDE
ncbi:MAG: hypothetical protein Kow0010_24740 [Dehalococcoidia bacterium]